MASLIIGGACLALAFVTFTTAVMKKGESRGNNDGGPEGS